MSRKAVTNILTNSFGFDPEESTHYFLVNIPRSNTEPVVLSEHFVWDPEKGATPVTLGTRLEGQIKSRLARQKWDAIADEMRTYFNQRLKRMGLRTGAWRTGPNVIRRELGKELVLIAWAIEDADPALVSMALANWNGLVPEERWWLYTQTAAATGHGVNDRGRGWRKAVRFALTENPITGRPPTESVVPEYFKRVAARPSTVREAQDDIEVSSNENPEEEA
jgi:hypothetical protein